MEISPPDLSAPTHWVAWIGVAAVAEAVWFWALYPLVPTTLGAASVMAALPLPLAAFIYGALRGLAWVAARTWRPPFKRALQLALATSVGVVAFGLVWGAEIVKSGQFKYWLSGQP